jgi:hypothetical protein
MTKWTVNLMSNVQVQPQRRIKPASVVYWMRFFLAICAGFANQLLRISETTLGDLALIVGIGVGVAFYLMSVLIVRSIFRYGEAELKDKNRHITLGGGTFIVVWVMIAVLLNSIW